MKFFSLPVLFLCLQSSCQPVNKDDDKCIAPVKAYQSQEPKPAQLHRTNKEDTVIKTKETQDKEEGS